MIKYTTLVCPGAGAGSQSRNFRLPAPAPAPAKSFGSGRLQLRLRLRLRNPGRGPSRRNGQSLLKTCCRRYCEVYSLKVNGLLQTQTRCCFSSICYSASLLHILTESKVFQQEKELAHAAISLVVTSLHTGKMRFCCCISWT